MTEMLQKTENVAKNVANENSQDLTECWEKGTLEKDRDYYITFFDNFPFIAKFKYHDAMIPYWKFEKNGIEFCNKNGYKCVKVLAPVPSYEEWQASYNCMLENEVLRLKNAELKETNEALEAELKEVCDVLIRKCPEMKEWVMMNWKHLYEVLK